MANYRDHIPGNGGGVGGKRQNGWPNSLETVKIRVLLQPKREAENNGNGDSKASLVKPRETARKPPPSTQVLGTPQFEVPAKPCDESALVHATKSGDIAAFEELVRLHERQLLRVAERVTRNHEDAQEAVQDAFLKLFQKLNQFQGNSKLSTWLFRVTVNESCMKLRKQRKTKELTSSDLTNGKSFLTDIPDSAPNPEELFTATELWENLIQASQKLRPSLRPIFWLRAVEGFSVAQIAGALNLSGSAVKAKLYRSRVQLREQLNKQSKREEGLPD